MNPANAGGWRGRAFGQELHAVFIGSWRIQRIVVFALSVLLVCAGAVLERYLAPHAKHDGPAKYMLVNADGLPLTHFFEGLPVKRVGNQTSGFLSNSQLRRAEPHSESFLRRWGSLFGQFFGFSSTVYAQTNCSGCGCVLAHMDCSTQHCEGGSFSTPSWCDGTNNQGVDVGNTSGCGCGIYDWTTCTNNPSNCPS
jgi:hypothetical protein